VTGAPAALLAAGPPDTFPSGTCWSVTGPSATAPSAVMRTHRRSPRACSCSGGNLAPGPRGAVAGSCGPAAGPRRWTGPRGAVAGSCGAVAGSCGPAAGPDSWTGPRGAVAGSCGAVTAEFAVTLPAVLLLLAMLLAGASAGATQLRLEEAARAGARALARGDDSATVERIVRTLSGGSASAAVSADGEWLNVTVTDRVGGPLGASIPWLLTARASTRSETAG
jgi:hypothetical protein